MLNDLAWALARHGDWRQAQPLAEAAVADAPWDSNAVDTLAMVRMQAGRCAEAVALETRAIGAAAEDAANLSKRFQERLAMIRQTCQAQAPARAP